MKYRHSFHAGNFADVHKQVTLLALLGALKKKEKGFLYLETHAGRGSYDLSTPTAEAAAGIGRFEAAHPQAEELRAYAAARLDESEVRDLTRRAHADYYLRLRAPMHHNGVKNRRSGCSALI